MHHFNHFSQSLAGRLSALPSQAAAAAASGSGQQPQQRLRLRPRHVAVSAAAAAAAGLGGMHLSRQVRLSQQQAARLQQRGQPQQFLIPRELCEVLCGAFGEIVQVALLYPLDTIKVRCQAGGLSVRAVMQQLAASGSPARALGQLYAGVAGASLASVAVGSLYYLTFCAAKRAATKLVADQQQQQQPPIAAAGSTVGSAAASHHFPHGSTVDCHCHDSVFAAICSEDAAAANAAAAKAARGGNPSSSSSSQPAAAASEPASSSSSSSTSTSSSPELSSHGKLQANVMAACAAALVGALVEAPVELFKHRAQAGQITGSMLGHVAQAVRQGGVLALYGSFFLPFCLKSLPFDVAELLTYSSLQDAKAAAFGSKGGANAGSAAASAAVQAAPAAAPAPAYASLTAAAAASSDNTSSGGLESMLSGVPEHAWDMAIGAAAGAAAVLISMPPDCIKTVMETGGGVVAAPGSGPLGSAGAFVGTGRQLLKQHGAGGLWMGLTPRLVESVPSTMFYWLAVEGCRRLLEPYTAK